MFRRILPLAAAVAVLGACDDTTGPESPSNLTIKFATVSTAGADIAMDAPVGPVADIEATGSNGTLTIDGIYVIVDKFKLEGAHAACEEVDDDDEDDSELDDCEEFESAPMLVSIPVDGTELDVLDTEIAVGTYSAIEWEVEDVELDEDDEEEAELQDVRAAIDSIFGEDVWPREASMAVTGSFLHTDSTEAQDFTTFFDAEIEVDREIEPPLEITDEGASRDLVITFDPQLWFTLEDGTVMDLAALSGSVVEFELEFEDGIASIEHDDDMDEDDEDDDS